MNFDQLITSLRELDSSLKGQVVRTANVGLTLRNWAVGAYIVEFEQNGEERAEYGTRLLPEIAQKLSIQGLNRSNLEFSRRLFVEYPGIPQTASGKFCNPLVDSSSGNHQTVSVDFRNDILQTLSALLPGSFVPQPIPQTLSGKLVSSNIGQTTSGLSPRPDFALPVETLFQKLTFSHLVELLRLDDPLQRAFYEIECVKGAWSVRELKRQIGSLLFERLGLSTDKEKLLRLTAAEIAPAQPADIIKDPYVFEFLGLTPKEAFRENDLETALLDHLQEFLLELGNGFCFEDRQKKIRIGQSDYFVDLVFYHRKLHCHVLIELHPMRYESRKVPLRLRSPQRQGRSALYGVHERPQAQITRTRTRKRQIYSAPFADDAHLLRGLPFSGRCHETRKVSQDRLGKTLHQRADSRLSHGVKVEPFNHANAGQLNTYVNYYRKHEMAEGDNPPVGLLLCTDKDHALVEYALGGMDENLFVSSYKVALPKPEELEAFLRSQINLPSES